MAITSLISEMETVRMHDSTIDWKRRVQSGRLKVILDNSKFLSAQVSAM